MPTAICTSLYQAAQKSAGLVSERKARSYAPHFSKCISWKCRSHRKTIPAVAAAKTFHAFSATLTWAEARDYCREQLDMELAIIESAEENTQAASVNVGDYWIGLHDQGNEGTW